MLYGNNSIDPVPHGGSRSFRLQNDQNYQLDGEQQRLYRRDQHAEHEHRGCYSALDTNWSTMMQHSTMKNSSCAGISSMTPRLMLTTTRTTLPRPVQIYVNPGLISSRHDLSPHELVERLSFVSKS
ncbi:unnamed protein product, partial [Amoebophrya sp. A120]|eukprot:GSA120T00019014001.1